MTALPATSRHGVPVGVRPGAPAGCHPAAQRGGPLFELSGVRHAVGGRTLLHGMDLVLRHGVCGLVGRSGSGKTTLLRLLARQATPDAGEIRLGGVPLHAWSGRALARRVAVMAQTPPAAPDLLVRELVAMGRYPWHGAFGRVRDADRRAVAAAMADAGVAPLAGRTLATLSGGERQRAWLATCVAQAAGATPGEGYLLLDEPISALDVAHQVEVLQAVRRLAADRGLAVVMVLHDVNLAARFCDELVALRDGRLVARGTPGQLMQVPVLQAIYGTRLGLLPRPAGGPPVSYVP